jgi:large repetitive protein
MNRWPTRRNRSRRTVTRKVSRATALLTSSMLFLGAIAPVVFAGPAMAAGNPPVKMFGYAKGPVQRMGTAAGLPHSVPASATEANGTGGLKGQPVPTLAKPLPPEGSRTVVKIPAVKMPAGHVVAGQQSSSSSGGSTSPSPSSSASSSPSPSSSASSSPSPSSSASGTPSPSGTASTASFIRSAAAAGTDNASYSVASTFDTVPMADQDGYIAVTLTNTGTSTWTGYSLGTQVFSSSDTNGSGTPISTGANVAITGAVAPNGTATVESITPYESPGSYTICWDVVNASGTGFADEGGNEYCAAYTILQYPAEVTEQEPLPGADVDSQTPSLSATATVPGGYPANPQFTFAFQILNGPNQSTATVLQSSGWVSGNASSWTPTTDLTWGTTYYWQVAVTDATTPPSLSTATWTTPISFTVGNAQPGVSSQFGSVYQADDGDPVMTSDLGGTDYSGSGKTVDPRTGNVSLSVTDASVETAGPALDITRTYNSLDSRTSQALGAGWSSELDMSLAPDSDGSGALILTLADGEQVRFAKNAAGGYAPPQSFYAAVTPVSGGGFTVTDQTGATWSFTQASGSSWLLSKVTDEAGMSETFGYTSGVLSTIANNVSGRSLYLTWATPSGASYQHVQTVSTDPVTAGQPSTALTWTYSYSGDLLTSMCPPGTTTACTKYGYITNGSHAPTAVENTDPDAYYRLDDPSGAAAAVNQIPVDELTTLDPPAAEIDTTPGVAGPISGVTATGFNGTDSWIPLDGVWCDGASIDTCSAVADSGRLLAGNGNTAGSTTLSNLGISVWFKTTAASGVLAGISGVAPGGTACLVFSGSTCTQEADAVPLLWIDSSGHLNGLDKVSTTSVNTSESSALTSAAVVDNGAWHQAVVIPGRALYLDGKLVASDSSGSTVTLPVPSYSTLGDFALLGAGLMTGSNPPLWQYFNGSMADVAIWQNDMPGPDAIAAQFAAETTPAAELNTITSPAGRASLSASYNTVNDRLTSLTDNKGGTWTYSSPVNTSTAGAYDGAVMADAPEDFWPLSDTSGPEAANMVGSASTAANPRPPATYSSVTLGQPGPMADQSAAEFTGGGNPFTGGGGSQIAVQSQDFSTAGPVSAEVWFNTTTSGQQILLQGANGALGGVPLQMEIDSGCLQAELQTAPFTVVKCASGSNLVDDGAWHQAVATLSPPSSPGGGTATLTLYLDGQQVGTVQVNTSATTGSGYVTYIGPGFTGSLADVSIYPSTLTADQVSAHYTALAAQQGVYLEAEGVPAANTQTITVTNPLGGNGKYVYASGALVEQISPSGGITRYGYDDAMRADTITDPDGDTTYTTHDARNNVTSATTCTAVNDCQTTYTSYYEDLSNPLDPRNDKPTDQRDARSSSPSDPAYDTVTRYLANGLVASESTPPTAACPAGCTTSYTYTTGSESAVGGGTEPPALMASMTAPAGGVTSYLYTSAGEVAQVTTPLGMVTKYTYDALGRELSETQISDSYPNGLTTSYAYDDQDRLVSETDPPVTDRVTGAVHTEVTTYTYDADGNVLTTTIGDRTGGDPSRVTTDTYDAFGNVASEKDALGNVTTYTYDAMGDKLTETNPAGLTTAYAYDTSGDLLTTTLEGYTGNPSSPIPAENLVEESDAYDPAGRLASATNVMGVTTNYTYYGNDKLASSYVTAPASVTTPPPGAPSGLTVTGATATTVSLSWTAPSGTVGGYYVYENGSGVALGSSSVTITGTTATVTGLSPSASYTFTVAGYNAAGTGAQSSSVSATTATTPPGTPTGLTVTGTTSTTVSLSWTAPSGTVTGYYVYENGSGTALGSSNVTISGTTATVTGLSPSTSYTFTVAAYNAGGSSAQTPSVSTTTPALPLPAAPTGLTVTGTAQTTVSLSWTAPSGTVGGYYVYENGSSTALGSSNVTISGTTATVTGLTASTSYTFTVAAWNSTGTGAQSSSVSATTAASPPPVPGAPTALTATGTTSTTVSLSWTAPSGSVTGYYVYENGSSTALGSSNVTITGTTATVTGLTASTSYTFTVAAYNTGGTGAQSSSVSATTAASGVPGAPTGLTATPEFTYALLAWTAPSGTVTGYYVYENGTKLTGSNVEIEGTEALVGGLTFGDTYSFTVAAYNSHGTGPQSAAVRFTDTLGGLARVATKPSSTAISSTATSNTASAAASPAEQDVRTYSYDAAGNLVSQTASGGLTVNTAYDADNQITSQVTDPTGVDRTATASYDSDGNVVSQSLSGGGVTQTQTQTYNAMDQLLSQTVDNTGGNLTTTYQRDQRGLVISETDPAGNTTTYQNDEDGRPVVTTGPAVPVQTGNGAPAVTASPITMVGYNTFGEETEFSDADGNVTKYGYDQDGEQVTITDPSYTPPGSSTPVNGTTTTVYNNMGQETSQTDPDGNVTKYTYDQLGDQASETDPGGGTWIYTYDPAGEDLSQTDPTGAQTQSTYTPLGQLATTTDLVRQNTSAAYTTTYAYDAAGNQISQTSPTGVTSTAAYDAVGEMISSTDGAGNTTTYAYDLDGHLVKETLPDGTAVTAAYDLAGRQTSMSDQNASGTTLRSSSVTYDLDGNITAATDYRGDTSTFTYDATGAPLTATQPVASGQSITVSYGYDLSGNRTALTDGNGNATYTTYNSLGLPETVTEPSTTQYSTAADTQTTDIYDGDGNLVTQDQPGGVQVTSVYDPDGQVTSMSGTGAAAPTASRAFTYDAAGRLLTAATAAAGTQGTFGYQPATSESFSWDDRGQLLSAAGTAGSSSFTYNGVGQETSVTDAAGTSSYTYDSAGRLATDADAASGTTGTYSYNDLDQVTSISYGSGNDTQSFGYDSLHRLTSDALTTSSGATVASIGYGYDNNDDVTSVTTTGLDTPSGTGTVVNTYGYDQADRLTSWTATPSGGTAVTKTYGYDSDGNLTDNNGVTQNYDARDELTSDSSGDSYTYTANGGMATQAGPGASYTFTSDAYGQQVTDGPSSYGWDALDRVVSAGEASNNSYSVALTYDGLSLDVASDPSAVYSRDPAGQITGVDSTGGGKTLALVDGHSDLSGTFTAAGTAMTSSTTWDPWGQQLASNGPAVQVGYQGQWADPLTEQVSMGSRFYRPAQGGFINQDSYTGAEGGAAVSDDLYAYADDNPVTLTDVSGHAPSSASGSSGGISMGEVSSAYARAAGAERRAAAAAAEAAGLKGEALAASGLAWGAKHLADLANATAHKFQEAASLAASLAAAAFAKAQAALAQAKYWQGQADAAWASARQHLDASHGWNPVSDGANAYDAGKETGMALYDEGRAAYYGGQYLFFEGTGKALQFAEEKAKSAADWFTARAKGLDAEAARFSASAASLSSRASQEWAYAAAQQAAARQYYDQANQLSKAYAAQQARKAWAATKRLVKKVVKTAVKVAKTVARATVSAAHWVAKHSKQIEEVGMAVAGVALTVANVAQLGLDPVTDAAEAADVGALATDVGVDAAEGVGEGAAEETGADAGTSVFRAPRLGQGDSELESGLNPANHMEDDQSAYTGTENVARDYANPKVGGYENGYVKYDMAPEFDSEFSQYKFPYVTTSGETGSEWQIPVNMIDRFNELTVNRSWVPWEP